MRPVTGEGCSAALFPLTLPGPCTGLSPAEHHHPITYTDDSRPHSAAVVPPRSAVEKLELLLQHVGLDRAPQRPAGEGPAWVRHLQHVEAHELPAVGR